MQALKERIRKEGKILPGNIVKVDGFLNHRVDCQFLSVDGFLNHRVDCQFLSELADEFGKHFDMSKVDVILTAEASGIPIATVCACRYNKTDKQIESIVEWIHSLGLVQRKRAQSRPFLFPYLIFIGVSWR